MLKMLLAACGGVCLAFATPAFAEGFMAQHDHFHIQGEGRAEIVRDIAEDLARYDATLREVFAVDPQLPKNPLEIYLVAKSKDAGRLATGQSGSDVAGWYSRHAEGSFVIGSQDGWSAERKSTARSVLLHEYTHHFLNRYGDEALPSWLSEGLAEFYSTTTFDANGAAVIGEFPEMRARSMARRNELPIESLLFSSPLELTNKVHREQFYNRAWLLVHMTEFNPEWSARLAGYRAALRAGKDARKAAASFGDLKALNAALDAYAAGQFAIRTVRGGAAAAGAIRVATLTDVQARLAAVRVERSAAGRHVGRLTAAYERAARVAAQYPNNADAHYELAKVADALGRASKSRVQGAAALRMTREQALDRSLGLQGDHAAANLLSGQVAMDELRANGRNDEAAWQAVRDKIRIAIQVDSDTPMALKAYYDSFIGERRPASAEAVEAMARAFALAPELPSVRTAYAWSLARRGDLLSAEGVMQKLALDPQGSRYAAMISVQFACMRKLQSAAG